MAKQQQQGPPPSENKGAKAARIAREQIFFSRALSGMKAPGRGKKKLAK